MLNTTIFDVEIEYEKTTTINITNEYKKGNIKINKTDAETSEGIEGVTFQLLDLDGNIVATAITDTNGVANFENIRIGSYKLKEIATNNNYILNTATFEVEVQYEKTTEVNITNEHKRGDLKVYKVDMDNNRVALGNVIFDLFSNEFQRVVGTYATDVNGEITIKNLRTGNYKLIERNTGIWYNLAEDIEVNINWNETTQTTVENELKKGQVKVIKVDKDNNEIRIPGVIFEVLDSNDNVLETITTDTNGEALTSRYAVRDFEKLKIREVKTLDTYELSDEVKTVELQANEITSITFENEKKKGQIKVIKVDTDNNEIKLSGVTFDILDEDNNVVDTIITDENGEAISKPLLSGKDYKVLEKETLENYVLTEEPQTITVEPNEIKDITFQNEKKKGQIRVIKVDADNNEILLEGVTFEILDSYGNIVDTITTNENGEAISKRLPITDTYTLREKETLQEYVLSEETQTVELQEDEIINITFENKKIKGYVEITKVDKNDSSKMLEGATFGIYDENDNLIQTLVTNENGKAISDLIPYGKYYLKELDTGSVYYLLNEYTFEFEIVNNDEIVPVQIDNEPTDITVDVDKTGTAEIKPGEQVNYTFSNVANNSNVYLENFKWYDYIPTDYIRLEKMTTGTWNQDLKYDVYYKTNKSDEYVLLKEDLSTQEDYELDFTKVELEEDEYIVETMFDFGKVDTGFRESTSPTMKCKLLNSLKDGQIFTNHTKTVGLYFGVTAEADSKWTTIVHIPEKPICPTLPKTGR